ncbi:hypothetical protein L873DRAFT_1823567 [Choiromyces venosus 120613-1]|uniref:Uncharacterized protein n=1 Tax=Choiromyces venosus 120613-1 TaxID=1336337 RepID=A0A3N4ISB7_9PEZI|nr:hypothetical protein L873DRAFT_1823567 [Choiromyces venosus 120613-1]
MAYYFGEQDSRYAGIFSPVRPYTSWSPKYAMRVASQNGAHYRLLSLLLVLGTSARLKCALSLPVHTEFVRYVGKVGTQMVYDRVLRNKFGVPWANSV